MLPLEGAIPMVMGANIGTSVTNLLVSLSMITRSHEFRRAISGAIVHDFFNLIAVLIFFPLELATGFIRWSAVRAAALFQGAGGAELVNVMDLIVSPVAVAVSRLLLEVLGVAGVAAGIILLALAVSLLFGALISIASVTSRLHLWV